MAEGLWRGWDELSTVPNGQQSTLRVIVLFTDGAANGVPGVYDVFPGEARSLNTSDFPDNGTNSTDNPLLRGMHDTETGVQSPSYSTTQFWTSTYTFPAIPLLPVASFHEHGRGSIPTSFPLETAALTVGGVAQSAVRGLRNFDAGTGRYPADIWNTNNAARNLVEIIADEARSDAGGDYRIRVFTIGMGDLLRYWVGTMPEQPEQIMMRVANDIDTVDYNAAQLEGKYYFAATPADVGPAFQELQSQIIRLTQ